MKKINLNPSKKELRFFGLVILVGFGLIGFLIFRAGHPNVARAVWWGAGSVCLLALVWPNGSKPFYRVWMAIGMAIGFVVSRLVLTILFYGLVTPIALFFRMRGRDELKVKKGSAPSYWLEHPIIEDKKYYDHLF